MKQLFLSVALALSATAFAQLLEVESVTPLKLQGVGRSVVTGVSPKGDFLLLSDAQLNGLAKYDLSTNRIEVISQARSAGLNVAVSADGRCVGRVGEAGSLPEGLYLVKKAGKWIRIRK